MSTLADLDLDLTPEAFRTAHALVLARKRNLSAQYDENDTAERAVAEWGDYIDDCALAFQRRMRFLRPAAGAPDYAAPIGTIAVDTDTGDLFVNTSGEDDGWVPVGGLDALGNLAGYSVLGNGGATAAVPGAVTAGTSGHVLRRSGTALAFGLLIAASFATGPGIVTPAMLDNGVALSVLGVTGGSGAARADIVSGGPRRVLISDGSNAAIAFRALVTADLPATVVDTGGARWESVRAIDFASWAATDFSGDADGTTHALDGGDGSITFTTQGAANANAGTTQGFFRRNAADSGDDGGSGLRIFHDASVSTNYVAATMTGPRLTIPITTLIPNFSPFEEYRFELQINRFGGEVGSPPANTTAFLVLYRVAATPTGSVAGSGGVALRRTGAAVGSPTVAAQGAANLPITASTHTYAAGTSQAHNVIAFSVGPAQQWSAYGADYSGGFPADTAYRALGVSSGNVDASVISPILDENALVVIGVATLSSSAGATDVMFRRLRVLRRIR